MEGAIIKIVNLKTKNLYFLCYVEKYHLGYTFVLAIMISNSVVAHI